MTERMKAILPWDAAEEVTFECEPGTLTDHKLKTIRDIGVTRLSLGVENFSDHIRGVERYNDPRAGKEVELPAGYGNAWANDLGEYIVSESPSFNPNIHSNQHWEPLTPAR